MNSGASAKLAHRLFDLNDGEAGLPDHERAVITQVQDVVRDVIAPAAKRYDESKEFPWDNIHALNALHLNRMMLPEAHGGYALSYAAYLMALREISRGCASTGLIWATNYHATNPVVDAASEAQKAKFLPVIAEGGLAAIAITEAHAGSNATAMRTRFVPDGDEIVVHGQKVYITSGDVADWVLVFGKWSELGDHKEAISALIVPKGVAGFNVLRLEDKLGHRASSTAALEFDGVRVPKENLVGAPGSGLRVLQDGLNRSRPSVAAHTIGIARAALDDILDYATTRRIGPDAILDFQANQFMLADLVGELLLCENMLWSVARLAANPTPEFPLMAGILKLRSGDLAVRMADMALQVHGGAGYCREFRAERLLRDARLAPIGEGTRETLAHMIGRNLYKLA